MSEERTPTGEASTGQLLVQATEDISQLIRDEMQLAKQDLAESGKRLGVGAGLFGVAGTLALYGVGTLLATIILAISEGLEPWIAAAIVTVVLFVAAAVAGLIGKARVSKVGDAPQARVESVKADIATATHGTDGSTS
ncbi:phage holin family protein [Aeromicrobium sp. SMF47]|uniref:Phage holin family protein n=1 Tax=Aeromicrobium yanjiei TaxID=2662028 RepID=A0A5Q2ME69_9ACTN|nr:MULTISPECIES: phage holin family protein [Aeromicrobium]MRJ75640.1 phage holin family protein [Aeromicrobium yanjiei]MRJ99984.1 phage holin family protein [Aeromicrobium sp. S22]QGG39941.1 phage holin family protein [Aeromicrobium yanjiei]